MLTIIISIVLALGVILILSNTKLKNYDITILVGAILFIGVTIASSPIYGYEEDVLIGQMQLVPMEKNTNVYVTCSENDVYTYKYESMNDRKSLEKTYDTNIIKGNIIENESKDCEQALLKIYKRKAKKGLFSFCWEKQLIYEFYVPEDGIKEIPGIIT